MKKKSRLLTAEEILADTNGERLMLRFCQAVEANQTPDDDVLRAVAENFRGVLSGEDPARALDLARPRGRPQRTAKQADEEFSRIYEVLLDVLDRQAEGKTKEVALEEAAEAWDVPEGTLGDWYKRHRVVAQVARTIRDRGRK